MKLSNWARLVPIINNIPRDVGIVASQDSKTTDGSELHILRQVLYANDFGFTSISGVQVLCHEFDSVKIGDQVFSDAYLDPPGGVATTFGSLGVGREFFLFLIDSFSHGGKVDAEWAKYRKQRNRDTERIDHKKYPSICSDETIVYAIPEEQSPRMVDDKKNDEYTVKDEYKVRFR
jgi:hypothetical protein